MTRGCSSGAEHCGSNRREDSGSSAPADEGKVISAILA